MSLQFDIVPLRKIPPFRVIGSKYSMLRNLLKVMKENKIEGSTFFDVFSGSGVVGRFFKKMYSIFSNDNLYFFFVLQKALITLNNYPSFKNLKLHLDLSLTPIMKIQKILQYLNNLNGTEGFIFSHYTPASKSIDGIERKYFTEENGKRIDSIRVKIEEWLENGFISEDEYFYLLASLLFAVQKVANISGTYGAFNKFWDQRARKPLTLKFIEVIPSKFIHKAFYEDAFQLIKRINCDIAYVDPPYNTRQYIANYHLLETIAKYDNPKIYGKTGIREYTEKEKSVFCSKKLVSNAFTNLLKELKTKWIILSYNSEGLLSKEKIIDTFEKVHRFTSIKVYEFPQRRFKSQANKERIKIKEYVFIAKVII